MIFFCYLDGICIHLPNIFPQLSPLTAFLPLHLFTYLYTFSHLSNNSSLSISNLSVSLSSSSYSPPSWLSVFSKKTGSDWHIDNYSRWYPPPYITHVRAYLLMTYAGGADVGGRLRKLGKIENPTRKLGISFFFEGGGQYVDWILGMHFTVFYGIYEQSWIVKIQASWVEPLLPFRQIIRKFEID